MFFSFSLVLVHLVLACSLLMPLPEKNQNNVHVNEMKPIKCVKNKGVCYLSVQFQHDLLPLSQMRSVHVDVTPTSHLLHSTRIHLIGHCGKGLCPAVAHHWQHRFTAMVMTITVEDNCTACTAISIRSCSLQYLFFSTPFLFSGAARRYEPISFATSASVAPVWHFWIAPAKRNHNRIVYNITKKIYPLAKAKKKKHNKTYCCL